MDSTDGFDADFIVLIDLCKNKNVKLFSEKYHNYVIQKTYSRNFFVSKVIKTLGNFGKYMAFATYENQCYMRLVYEAFMAGSTEILHLLSANEKYIRLFDHMDQLKILNNAAKHKYNKFFFNCINISIIRRPRDYLRIFTFACTDYNLEIMNFLVENKYVVLSTLSDGDLYYILRDSNHEDNSVIKYLINNGICLDSLIIGCLDSDLSPKIVFEVMQYYCENKHDNWVWHRMVKYAINNDMFKAVKYLDNYNPSSDTLIFNYACKTGKIRVVEYMYNKNNKLTVDCHILRELSERNHVAVLLYLIKNGRVIEPDNFSPLLCLCRAGIRFLDDIKYVLQFHTDSEFTISNNKIRSFDKEIQEELFQFKFRVSNNKKANIF